LADTAGVLFANKAGELLTFKAEDPELGVEQRIQDIERLSRSWGLSCLVLYRDQACVRLIMYRPAEVQEALSKVPGRFLEKLGYPCDTGPVEFLEEVGRRWQKDRQIPHEIGIALGYPVKDVLGYMGLISLKHTGQRGWKIYGDPGPSLRRSRRYERARDRAMAVAGA
jgi:hypothetical protein